MARFNHLRYSQGFHFWWTDFCPLSVGINHSIQVNHFINVLLEYFVASIAVLTKKTIWNYHNLSDLILWPYKKTQLTLMAHRRLDAELIRPGKEQFQPLIEWMLSKIWRWHHCKKQRKQMVKLIYALQFDIFFSSFLFVCLLAQLTGSKIVHRPLCCSNHRHNHQVSCRKYHKVIRKQCTLTRAIGWSTRPTVYNIRIDNIPWCKHRLC